MPKQVLIYRRAPSDSANFLAQALKGARVRLFDGEKFWRRHPKFPIRIKEGDVVICWGEELPTIEGVKIFNSVQLRDKLEDAVALQMAGVPTVEVSESKREGWLPRRANHIGGHDLLHPPSNPDYWVKRENLVEEYRIHCFQGKSIRAGKKVHREGHTAHDWVRSLDGGWRIMYDGFKSKKDMRALAGAACQALGLDFAAVDIGKKKDGGLIVLEANRAPGLEGNTITAYAAAIEKALS